jgi:hypothetical protein
MRWFAAFMIAPLPGVLLFMSVSRVSGPSGAAFVAFVSLTIGAWLIQLLPGLQIAAWANGMGARRWWHYMLAGMATYLLPAIGLGVWEWTGGRAPVARAVAVAILVTLVMGISSGLTVWIVFRPQRRRSDAAATVAKLQKTFD